MDTPYRKQAMSNEGSPFPKDPDPLIQHMVNTVRLQLEDERGNPRNPEQAAAIIGKAIAAFQKLGRDWGMEKQVEAEQRAFKRDITEASLF